MNIYKLKISYKGTDYKGWQVQPNMKTVQGELNRAISRIFKTDDFKTIGSGRTDTGVHALGQIVKLTTPFKIKDEGLLKALNSHLPEDIRVLEVEETDDSFHPVFHSKKKEYHYYFTLNEQVMPFYGDRIVDFSGKIDIEQMKKACSLFIGEHDFISFRCVGTDIASTIRTIYSCEISDQSFQLLGCEKPIKGYVLKIVGNGFLKQMVRMIMGAIVSVGQGRTSFCEIEQELKNPSEKRLGITAPGQGLYMVNVDYEA